MTCVVPLVLKMREMVTVWAEKLDGCLCASLMHEDKNVSVRVRKPPGYHFIPLLPEYRGYTESAQAGPSP